MPYISPTITNFDPSKDLLRASADGTIEVYTKNSFSRGLLSTLSPNQFKPLHVATTLIETTFDTSSFEYIKQSKDKLQELANKWIGATPNVSHSIHGRDGQSYSIIQSARCYSGSECSESSELYIVKVEPSDTVRAGHILQVFLQCVESLSKLNVQEYELLTPQLLEIKQRILSTLGVVKQGESSQSKIIRLCCSLFSEPSILENPATPVNKVKLELISQQKMNFTKACSDHFKTIAPQIESLLTEYQAQVTEKNPDASSISTGDAVQDNHEPLSLEVLVVEQ